MPCCIKVRVVAARDLPIMDKASKLTDAYVELQFRGEHAKKKTEICRKTLNPVWDQEFRVDVLNDVTLQDEPLVFRVMDHDTYSADDLIGAVYVELNPLLQRIHDDADNARSHRIEGWFPIYDTLCGARCRRRRGCAAARGSARRTRRR